MSARSRHKENKRHGHRGFIPASPSSQGVLSGRTGLEQTPFEQSPAWWHCDKGSQTTLSHVGAAMH